MIPSSQGKNIRVVEDDLAAREALAQFLAQEGHAVALAGNGEEALAYLRANAPPDLVLLDLMMPVQSGWGFRQAQALDVRLARVPVVVLSAVGELALQADALGDVGYLQKPIDFSELPAVIARFARARKPAALIVEDEPAILMLLEKVLRHYGFAVHLATGGEEAVDAFRRHQDAIDVVLLDVRMAPMDGPQALIALQQIAPQVRVAFMSGNTGKYAPEELVRRGAKCIFAKPFASLTGLAEQLWELAGA